MWDGAPFLKLISPSISDARTPTEEDVVASGASASSVDAGTSLRDEVDAGAICLSSSPSMSYSSSSTKILSSIFLSLALSKTSRVQGAISSKVTSHDSTMVLVSRLSTLYDLP
jgi:hypothetical protein